MHENKVLNKLFGPKKYEVRNRGTMLHN